MLVGLPMELLQHILSYCRIMDAKNLSACSRQYNEMLKPNLWNYVAIPNTLFTRPTFTVEDRRMQFMGLVNSLCITKGTPSLCSENVACASHAIDLTKAAIVNNFKSMIVKTDSLTELSIHGFVVDDVWFGAICTQLGAELLILRLAMNKVTEQGFSHTGSLQKLQIFHLGKRNKTLEFDNGCLNRICLIRTLEELIIDLGCREEITDTSCLRHLVYLQRLSLCDHRFLTIEDFRYLEEFQILKEFRFEGNHMPNNVFTVLGTLENLEVLTLRVRHNEFGATVWSSLRSLKKVDLSKCQVKKEALQGLAALSHLESLILCGNIFYNARFLCEMISLKELDLCRCSVNDRDLSYLTALVQLQLLNINYCRDITDNGISHICFNLTNLRELHISFLPMISNAGLEALKKLKKLEKLFCSGSGQTSHSPIDSLGFSHISTIGSLRVLHLSHYQRMTDICVSHLSNLKGLEQLNLAVCINIGDESLAHLSNLLNLRHLDLRGCVNLTTNGLKYLKKLTKMETINLRGIPYLAQVTGEQQVQLPFGSSVRVKGLHEMV